MRSKSLKVQIAIQDTGHHMAMTMAIEKVTPGLILAQEIQDLAREKTVYKPGIRLTAEIINNILSLEYLEIEVAEATDDTPNPGSAIPSKVFKPGEFICFKGEPAQHIYILKRGVVQVISTEENPPLDDMDKAKRFVGENGKIISQIRGAGVKFGEMAAILHGARSASIKCNTEVEVAMISTNEQAFKKTLLYNPKLGLSLANTMAKRLQKTRRNITQIRKFYLILTKKILMYQTAFTKIQGSVTAKSEQKHAEWLLKLVAELKNIPPLSDFRKFKPQEVERKVSPVEMKEQVLPPEMESVVPINSYLTLPGKLQENFFLLKKGKIEEHIDENNVIMHSRPGTFIEHIAPLVGLKKFKGAHARELKSISPVRLFKIPVHRLEETVHENPNLILFLCKSLAKDLMDDDHYMFALLAAFESDLGTLAIGDTNYRRAFKKLSRIMQKFSKDPGLMKTEITLSSSLQEQVDKDYATFKDGLNKIFLDR